MQITEIPTPGYEHVVRGVDRASGLHAIIAIHDTTLGPSLGGLRMWQYGSEDEALFDVLRLAKGMTYKSAVARTGVGGGKSVIIGDPARKSEALYLAMGRFIETLAGSYITAEDVNTTIADLEVIRRATKHVSGLSEQMGGSGNPSPFTAYGVFLGIGAALEQVFGSNEMRGRRIGVQGVGAVGSALTRRLLEARAEVLVADAKPEKVQAMVQLGAKAVTERELFGEKLDVFAPCALGAVINDDTIPRLRCPIVAGAANNLLLEPRHGKALEDRGILYAPDYVINAGGIINVATELMEGGYNRAFAMQRIEHIPAALKELWALAKERKIPASEAADRLAEDILAEAKMAKGNA